MFGFEKQVYQATEYSFTDNNGVYIANKQHIEAPRVVNLTGPNQMYLKSSYVFSKKHGANF